MDSVPKGLFPENYERLNLYLQNFSMENWSVLCTNLAYLDAIDTSIRLPIRLDRRISAGL